MENQSSTNPTADIDLNFGHYLERRDRELNTHIINGVPDYAFSLDQKLRQQLTKMRAFRSIAQTIVGFAAPIQRQIHQMESVAVSPKQFPKIYEIGKECAEILGIGIPQIFVCSGSLSDSYTIATDDIAPIIVLSNHLIEALEPEELKFVIGHECGHIHNLHGVYNSAVEIMTNPLAQLVLESMPNKGILQPIIHGGLNIFFKRWSRCAEITCDRAGLICCGNFKTAQSALAKFVTGGGQQQINIEEYINQINQKQQIPIELLNILEFDSTHPLIPKRMKALCLFAECEVFYSWHKELHSTNPRSKEETDNLCELAIRILPQGH